MVVVYETNLLFFMKKEFLFEFMKKTIYTKKLTFPFSLGSSVTNKFNKIVNLSKKQLNSLFTVPPFKEEKWASGLVDKAKKLRDSQISLSAKLQGNIKLTLRETLINIVGSIGMPVIFNNNYDAWIQSTSIQLKTPLMFLAIYSIHKILNGKQTKCNLTKYCENNKAYWKTGAECYESPWVRAAQGKSCYFSNVWEMWELKDIQIRLSNKY